MLLNRNNTRRRNSYLVCWRRWRRWRSSGWSTLPPLLCPFFFFVLVILRTVGFRASSIWSISCAPPVFCFYVFAERRTKTMIYEGVVASPPPLFRSFPSVFSSISFLWCLCLSSCSLSVCLFFFIVPCVFLLFQFVLCLPLFSGFFFLWVLLQFLLFSVYYCFGFVLCFFSLLCSDFLLWFFVWV